MTLQKQKRYKLAKVRRSGAQTVVYIYTAGKSVAIMRGPSRLTFTTPLMTTKNKRLDRYHSDDEPRQPAFESSDQRDGRRIRRLHPLGFRVVARIVRDSNVTDSGLYLPEGAKETMQESILAEVIEVASTVDSRTEEETNVSGIPLGSLVLIPKTLGIKVPWDEDLRIIDTREILALVDEIALT